ncbi:hypothetical protein [Bacillus badius]|uniref:Uncharacterized protein n=1 Tax=Bacillus badius TaxID=1455 RepID=A0ABR5ANK4_BACBA|nr:hypothetical protein [Bacillus badius]KIL72039.1 hypothetical protein SD77_3599 [Bacillus badius]MED4718259.1 hypothetical protein [Bacillus badius]
MEKTYKQLATETYMKTIETHFTTFELELIKSAFETGFNIGACDNGPKLIQEIALNQLAKKTVVE